MPKNQIYIYPTDTVWGIGCDIYSEVGLKEIARIKNTTYDKPLSILFTDIEQVMASFHFPSVLTKKWLEIFFQYESTLGIPVKWSKISIPPWVNTGSEFVSIRCLNSAPLKSLYKELGNPFFTTSLNLQGQNPILTKIDAEKFLNDHCPNAVMIKGLGESLSGESSSIIFFDEKMHVEFKREGRQIQSIKNHLDLLHLV